MGYKPALHAKVAIEGQQIVCQYWSLLDLGDKDTEKMEVTTTKT